MSALIYSSFVNDTYVPGRVDQNKFICISLNKLVKLKDDSLASLLIRKICQTVEIQVQSSKEFNFKDYDIDCTIKYIINRSYESPYVCVLLGHLYTDIIPIKNIDEANKWYITASNMNICSPLIYTINGMLHMERTEKNCVCDTCVHAYKNALLYFRKSLDLSSTDIVAKNEIKQIESLIST